MLDDKFKKVFDDFVLRLNNAGYNVQWALLDAVNYRIPQNRERVFFVGFRKDLNVSFMFPTPTCIEPVTLEKAIGDITEDPVCYHGSKEKVVKDLGQKYLNHDVLTSNFGHFYYRGNRRRGWQQPSFTINATADFAPLHPSSPKMMFFGHENWNFQKEKQNEYRRLSVRECARIQTFPDNFFFDYDNIKDAYKMIGNAVPPRLGYEIAKSILGALSRPEVVCTFLQEQPKSLIDATVLVGYYKGDWHKQLILKNQLYYVRSDGRKGSVFMDDCSVMPKYLLLHHKDDAELFELDAEEPVLADASYLKTLGFVTYGETYLCFRLKSAEPKNCDIVDSSTRLNFDTNNYVPYFTKIKEVLE